MILSSKSKDGAPITEYALVMTPYEYEQALKGKVLTHVTACGSMSGKWEVRFRKNSKKRHKELYG